jgi:hypothetical protein
MSDERWGGKCVGSVSDGEAVNSPPSREGGGGGFCIARITCTLRLAPTSPTLPLSHSLSLAATDLLETRVLDTPKEGESHHLLELAKSSRRQQVGSLPRVSQYGLHAPSSQVVRGSQPLVQECTPPHIEAEQRITVSCV